MAIEYYEKAANQNCFDAILFLADIFYEGNIVNRDYTKAYKYYKMLKKQNDSRGILKLAYMFYEGIGVEQNINKALKYYESLAKKKNSEAFYELGNIYYNGKFVKRDIEKALTNYELYVKYVNTEYSYNPYYNFKISENQQYIIYLKKIKKSYIQCLIGQIYFDGIYVKKYYEKSIKSVNIRYVRK